MNNGNGWMDNEIEYTFKSFHWGSFCWLCWLFSFYLPLYALSYSLATDNWKLQASQLNSTKYLCATCVQSPHTSFCAVIFGDVLYPLELNFWTNELIKNQLPSRHTAISHVLRIAYNLVPVHVPVEKKGDGGTLDGQINLYWVYKQNCLYHNIAQDFRLVIFSWFCDT